MILTKEQQAILDGAQGETLAKVMKTLVMYGDAFEAEKLVPPLPTFFPVCWMPISSTWASPVPVAARWSSKSTSATS